MNEYFNSQYALPAPSPLPLSPSFSLPQSRPSRSYWGPMVVKLDLAGGWGFPGSAALKALSKCPFRRQTGIRVISNLRSS